jgi:hypothetical protein
MYGSPQVEHVTVSAAIGMKALKDVFAQMDGEGGLRLRCLAVDRAGAAGMPWPEGLRWWDVLKWTHEQLRQELSTAKKAE